MNHGFEEVVTVGIKSSAILRYEKTFFNAEKKECVKPMLKISLRQGDTFYLSEEDLYRMLRFLDIFPDIEVQNDWGNIDTSLVKNYPDDVLLEQAKFCTFRSGWGIIAEVCKRYAVLKSQSDGRRSV